MTNLLIKRRFETVHRTPQLYGMHKVRKNFTDYVPFRPVNSQFDSLSAMTSKFVDYYLKNSLIYSRLREKSLEVCNRLKHVNLSQSNTSASKSDTIAIYPNINNEEGITTCEK